MKIKVCGITTVEQLQQLQALEADYAGLIFYEKSKRFAWGKLKDKAAEIKNIPIEKVGVFVNADMDFLKSCVEDFDLTAVQLHGDETAEYCAALQQETTVIKVFRIYEDLKNLDVLLEPFQQVCDYFLFDTDTTSYGGSGKHFDWKILETAVINKPFFLSGGIGPDDMDNLKTFRHSFLYAIDINSRFETAPGLKDMPNVKTFLNTVKQPLYG